MQFVLDDTVTLRWPFNSG